MLTCENQCAQKECTASKNTLDNYDRERIQNSVRRGENKTRMMVSFGDEPLWVGGTAKFTLKHTRESRDVNFYSECRWKCARTSGREGSCISNSHNSTLITDALNQARFDAMLLMFSLYNTARPNCHKVTETLVFVRHSKRRAYVEILAVHSGRLVYFLDSSTTMMWRRCLRCLPSPPYESSGISMQRVLCICYFCVDGAVHT